VVDKLAAMRGPGESYSDVILRAAAEPGCNRDETAVTTITRRA
jgi:hypothetical protein